MLEIVSFADASSVVYRRSQGIKILPGPVNRRFNPRKRPELDEITSFSTAPRVVYRGSQGIEILTGLENHGL